MTNLITKLLNALTPNEEVDDVLFQIDDALSNGAPLQTSRQEQILIPYEREDNYGLSTSTKQRYMLYPEYDMPTQPTPLIAPSGYVRCLIAQKIGDQRLIIRTKTVQVSQRSFSINMGGTFGRKEWATFLIEPSRVFMILPMKRLFGLKTVQMPHLLYDLEDALPLSAKGSTAELVLRARKMPFKSIPSLKLGDIMRHEILFQGMKSLRKQGNEIGMLSIIMTVMGVAIGLVIGMLIHTAGVVK